MVLVAVPRLGRATRASMSWPASSETAMRSAARALSARLIVTASVSPARTSSGVWTRNSMVLGARTRMSLAVRNPGARAPRTAGGPLWIPRTVEPLSVRSISKTVTTTMARAGIEESAHALRHTVATRLVRDHAHDLVLVADILGHADVKTTRRYARSDLEQRRAALEDLAD